MNNCIFEHTPHLGINDVYHSAQLDVNSHQRLRKELAKIYEQNQAPDFIMEFLQCLSCCLSVQEKHPCIEKALEFASGFLAQHYQDMEEVLVAVFEFIFKNHSSKTQSIRLRCCEFMNRLLLNMDDSAGLYDDLYEKIASTMQERLQDKVPSIRAQAVMALQRLQNPQDPSCRIIKAFIFHMERDPSADVRVKVIKHIAVTPKTLPALFEMIYDVKCNVRKEAYKTLSRLRVVKLTIKQRQKICSAGVRDTSELVKSFVLNNMVLTWYKQCDCDFITFLKILFVETMDGEILESLLFHLFKKQPTATLIETITKFLSKEKVLPLASLSPENVTLWLHVIKYLSATKESDELDKDVVLNIVPELTKYAKYLKDFSLTLSNGNKEKEFIVIQLFKIASTYSFDDEMGREQMRMMCINYFVDENIGKDVVPAIVRVFEQLVPSVKDRLVMMAEIISDIREPLQPSQSSTDDGLNEVQQKMSQLSCASLDSDRIQKNDAETLVKCLTIIIEVFKAKDVTKVDATLLSLKDHFVLECFKSPSREVQGLALDVMAFFCIWSLDIAKENFLKFCFEVSRDDTCLSALGCIIDILLVHGFHPFSLHKNSFSDKHRKGAISLDDCSSDPTLTPSQVFIVSLVINLLDSKMPEVRARACQGLAKLLLCGHLNSSLVLARLILIWFNPSSASEPEIRQPLGMFLNLFSTRRRAGEVILNSVIIALKAIQEMESECDDEDEIDPMSVAKLLVSLLRADVCPPPENIKEEGSFHLQLATKVCRELAVVNSLDPLVLAKIIQMVEFQPQDARCCSNLLLLVCRGIKRMGKFWDKKVLKAVQGLKIKLEEMKQGSSDSIISLAKTHSLQSIKETDLSTKEVSSLQVVEEESALNLPDVTESYSTVEQVGGRIDDSDAEVSPAESPILKPSASSSTGNMVIDETVEGEDPSLINAYEAPNSRVEETAYQSSDDEMSSDGEIIPAKEGGIVPDSDSEACSGGSDEDDVPTTTKSTVNIVVVSTDEEEGNDESCENSRAETQTLRPSASASQVLPTTPLIQRTRSARNAKQKADAELSLIRTRSARDISSSSAISPRQTRSTRKRRLT